MAHYVEGSFKGYTAGATLTNGQAVKLNSTLQVIPASAATDKIIGVVNQDVTNGWSTDVRLRSATGTICIKAGGTIAIGDAVTSDTAGLGVATTTAGNQIIGYALEAGVAGAQVELLPSTAKV